MKPTQMLKKLKVGKCGSQLLYRHWCVTNMFQRDLFILINLELLTQPLIYFSKFTVQQKKVIYPLRLTPSLLEILFYKNKHFYKYLQSSPHI